MSSGQLHLYNFWMQQGKQVNKIVVSNATWARGRTMSWWLHKAEFKSDPSLLSFGLSPKRLSQYSQVAEATLSLGDNTLQSLDTT